MVVGIDFSTHALHLCALGEGPPRLTVAPLRDRNGSLTDAITTLPSALAFALERLHVTRADCWIERGHGPNRNADWALGAIAGALLATWPRLTYGSTARLIPTADWKKHMGAPGNASKTIANRQTTLHWNAHHPGIPAPTDHNHLDAYAIAATATTR